MNLPMYLQCANSNGNHDLILWEHMNDIIITMTQHLHCHLEMDLLTLHSVPPLICPQLSLVIKSIVLHCPTNLFSHSAKSPDGYNLFKVELNVDLSS